MACPSKNPEKMAENFNIDNVENGCAAAAFFYYNYM